LMLPTITACLAISVNFYPQKLGSYTAFESSQTQFLTGRTSVDHLLHRQVCYGFNVCSAYV
jgi:hypothetical protein